MSEAPVSEASVSSPADTTAPENGAETVEVLFQKGIERYQAGEDPKTLIPVFKGLCDRAPKSSASWTCLSWLYLITGQANLAHSAAKKGVRLNPEDPQARVNLAAAAIDSGQKGVREQVEFAQQLLMIDEAVREEVRSNLQDGLERHPASKGLQRVNQWLFAGG